VIELLCDPFVESITTPFTLYRCVFVNTKRRSARVPIPARRSLLAFVRVKRALVRKYMYINAYVAVFMLPTGLWFVISVL
jgi:hypothetical protein